jgi:hypothetical protein
MVWSYLEMENLGRKSDEGKERNICNRCAVGLGNGLMVAKGGDWVNGMIAIKRAFLNARPAI